MLYEVITSDLKVSGRTNKLYAEASSGSDIKAGNLEAVSRNNFV